MRVVRDPLALRKPGSEGQSGRHNPCEIKLALLEAQETEYYYSRHPS
jgi:hypothetical protein